MLPPAQSFTTVVGRGAALERGVTVADAPNSGGEERPIVKRISHSGHPHAAKVYFW